MRKVVVDTNVLVSSFFGGKPRDLLHLWRDGGLAICLSDEILAEYLEAIARFGDGKAEVRELLAVLSARENVILVSPREQVHAVRSDPDDDKFLECALAAGADAIVSGDRHLLSLGEFRGIPILGPARFLKW